MLAYLAVKEHIKLNYRIQDFRVLLELSDELVHSAIIYRSHWEIP